VPAARERRPPVNRPPPRDGYAEASRRPLETLFFLLPLLGVYELGLASWLRSGGQVVENLAHISLVRLLLVAGVKADQLGLPLLSLPAVGLLLTLLAWQVIGRFPWVVRLPAVAGMYLEGAAMAIPLAAINMAAAGRIGGGAAAPGLLAGRDLLTRVTVAIGAGVYEELLFRMGLMGAMHMLLADVAGWKGPGSWIAAVVASALLFAGYHGYGQGASLGAWGFLFLAVAGSWWGLLYHWRGFGIAVGAHIAYDLTVLLPRG
jgi:hypothetical protein